MQHANVATPPPPPPPPPPAPTWPSPDRTGSGGNEKSHTPPL
ncbi:hypothetical protein [Rhodoferax sp.]